eukprot:CFRG7915T1
MPLLTGILTVEIREARNVPISSSGDCTLVCYGSVDSVPYFFRTLAANKAGPMWTEKFTLKVRNAARLILHCGSPSEALVEETRHPIIIHLHEYAKENQKPSPTQQTLLIDEWMSGGENTGKVHLIVHFSAEETDALEPVRHEYDVPQLHKVKTCEYCEVNIKGSSIRCFNCGLVIHVNCKPFIGACCPGLSMGRSTWTGHQNEQNSPMIVNVNAKDNLARKRSSIVYGRRKSSGNNIMPNIIEPVGNYSNSNDQIAHKGSKKIDEAVETSLRYLIPSEHLSSALSLTDLSIAGGSSQSLTDESPSPNQLSSTRDPSSKFFGIRSYALCISNVLARNIPKGMDASVRFDFGDRRMCTEAIHSSYPVYKLNKTIEFNMSDIELHATTFKISLCHKEEVVGEISFVGSEVLVGPRHFDVELVRTHAYINKHTDIKSVGRVRADVSLEEYCDVTIDMLQLGTESLGVLNKCPFKIKYALLDEDKEVTRMESTQSPVTREPSWTQEDLTELQFKSSRMKLTDGRIFFQLWKCNIAEVHGDVEADEEKRVHGEVYFSLVKVFQQMRHEEITFKFRTTLQYEGTSAGFLIGSLKLTGHPKRFQLQGGVMTENGISVESPVVLGDVTDLKPGGLSSWWKVHTHKKKSVILPRETEHMKSVINNLTLYYTKPYRKRSKTKERDMLQALVVEVCTSHKATMTSFVYINHESMIGSVQIFLTIWKLILNHLDDTVYANKKVAYQLIIGCMQRSELVLLLHLLKLGPDKDLPFELTKQVIIEARHSLFRTLGYCLQKMNSKVMFGELKVFCAKVIAITCYMMPSILNEVQEAILPQKIRNEKMEEWGQAQLNLEEPVTDALDPIVMEAIYNDFEDIPYVDKKTLENMKETIPHDKTWLAEIRKRKETFYHVCGIFANHMYNRVVLHEHLKWHMVPGYRYVIKAVLVEMRSMPPEKYTNAMLRCQDFLICNPDTLTVLMTLMFKNTRCQDVIAATAAIGHLDRWFSALEINIPSIPQRIPKTFDFDLFFLAVERLLQSEHCQILSGTINLLMSHVDMLSFYPAARQMLYKNLLVEKNFFRFFLHYDASLREYFHAMVIHVFLAKSLLPPKVYKSLNDSEDPRYVTRMNEFGDVETWLYNTQSSLRGVSGHSPRSSSPSKILALPRNDSVKGHKSSSKSSPRASIDTLGSIKSPALSCSSPITSLPRIGSNKNIFNMQAEQQEELERSLHSFVNQTDCRVQFFEEGVTGMIEKRIAYVRERAKDYRYDGDGKILCEAVRVKSRSSTQLQEIEDDQLVYTTYALLEFDSWVDEYKEVSQSTHRPPDMPVFDYQTRLKNYLDMSE